jgi:phosphonate transport system substrate-binding protein
MDMACRLRLGKGSGSSCRAGFLLGLLALGLSLQAEQVAAAKAPDTFRFGILPIGSAAESRDQWQPLLQDLEKKLGRPVHIVSVSSYAGLFGAIKDQRVDAAFLSGRLATEAVEHQHMSVIAQFVRGNGGKGNVAMLIVRSDGAIHQLEDMFAKPGHWRYARSEMLSVGAYIAPEAEVFAPRGLNSDTFFASVRVGNQQNNALAVVNDEVDVAACDGPDLYLFREDFPGEASQLKVIWQSAPLPSEVLVVRESMPAPLRSELLAFMHGYGHSPGATGEREHGNLSRIPDLIGFTPADNRVLQPFVDMEFLLIREQAQHGQWVNDQAREARLAQIDADYQRALRALLQH